MSVASASINTPPMAVTLSTTANAGLSSAVAFDIASFVPIGGIGNYLVNMMVNMSAATTLTAYTITSRSGSGSTTTRAGGAVLAGGAGYTLNVPLTFIVSQADATTPQNIDLTVTGTGTLATISTTFTYQRLEY